MVRLRLAGSLLSCDVVAQRGLVQLPFHTQVRHLPTHLLALDARHLLILGPDGRFALLLAIFVALALADLGWALAALANLRGRERKGKGKREGWARAARRVYSSMER